ncbi:unnamed protein product, partial [Urochloa humidicola]
SFFFLILSQARLCAAGMRRLGRAAAVAKKLRAEVAAAREHAGRAPPTARARG